MLQGRRKYLLGSLIGLLAMTWTVSRVVVLTRTSRLEVGPRTTFLEGSVQPDGTFDFESALHQKSSAGITPENNAAVLLEQACGRAEMPLDLRRRYYQYLGMAEPLASGKYLVLQEMFAQQETNSPQPRGEKFQILLDEMTTAQARPWSRTEFPRVAKWIDLNVEPLKLIEQASRRTEYYAPLVTSGSLLDAPLPLAQNMRTVARLLVTRAMLRISDGDLDGAARDLLTCHRLASLLGQNTTLIGALTAISLDAAASQGDQVWLAQPLTVEQIRRFQSEFQKLPEIGHIAPTLDLHERVTNLDSLQSFWTGKLDSAGKTRNLRLVRIDINAAFRRVNDHYDSLRGILQSEDSRARQTALANLHDTLKQRAQESVAPLRLAVNYIWNSRTTVTTSTTEVLLLLTAPVATQAQSADDRSRMRRQLVSLALALAEYRVKHGGYPDTLEALKPEFLKQIPLDSYISSPLIYRIHPEGYVLYAVGPNEKDDGGQSRDGRVDDVAFEVMHATRTEDR